MSDPVAARPRTLVWLLAALLVGGPIATSVALAAEAKPAAKKSAPAKKKAPTQKPVTAEEAVKQLVEGEHVRDFRTFCDEWMGKLRERTAYNVAHVAWAKGGPGVFGEYVSYGTDRTCVAKEEPGKVPIGKITYREVKYRKEGATEAAAVGSTGTIVEQTDVTEIFRFAKGRWQY